MNIGKSVEIALISKGMKKRELAEALGVTSPTVSSLCSSKTCSGKMLERLTVIFEMKASELVALGE